MSPEYSNFLASETTFFSCGNCGVKLEADPPIGFEQLTLKGPLYPEEGSSSVSTCGALSAIFKVKVPYELGDAALCCDCTAILQQLYKIWQSFFVKSNPSANLYLVLTEENTEIDDNDNFSNSSHPVTKKKTSTKARLKAKIARRVRDQSIENVDTDESPNAKLKRKESAADDQLRKVTPEAIQSPKRRGRPKKGEGQKNKIPQAVPRKGVRQSLRKQNIHSNLNLVSPCQQAKKIIESYSTPHNVLNHELHVLTDSNSVHESEKPEPEAENLVQVKVDLSDDESETSIVAAASSLHEYTDEWEPPETFEEVNNRLLSNTEADLNFETYKLTSFPLPEDNATNYTETEDSKITTRRSLRKATIRTPTNPEVDGHTTNGGSLGDFSADSESDADGCDSDFDPADVDMTVRDRDLEKRKNKNRLRRDQRGIEKELLLTGQTSKRFTCNKCGRRFRKELWLDKHINIVHLKVKPRIHHGPHICTFENCGKKLGNPSALESHMNQHLGIKPCICDQCAWSTTSNPLLLRHLRTHLNTEEKDELKTKVCHVCGTKYYNDRDLSRHMLVHVEDRPYSCSFEGCDFKYKSQLKLQRHELEVHSNRKFSCERCGREFNRKDNLLQHLKVHEKYDLNGGKMRKSRDPPVRSLTKKIGDAEESDSNSLTVESPNTAGVTLLNQ